MVELKMVPKGLKSCGEEHGRPIYNIDGANFIAEQYFCDDDGNPVLRVCMNSCEDCLHEGCNSCIYGPNQHLDRKYFYSPDAPCRKTYKMATKAFIYNLEQCLMSENPNKETCADLLTGIWKLRGFTPVEELDRKVFTDNEIAIMKIGYHYAGALAKFYFSNDDFEIVMNSLSPNEQVEVLVHKLNKHWPGMRGGNEYSTKQSIAYGTMLRQILSDNKLTLNPDEALLLNRIAFKMRSDKND